MTKTYTNTVSDNSVNALIEGLEKKAYIFDNQKTPALSMIGTSKATQLKGQWVEVKDSKGKVNKNLRGDDAVPESAKVRTHMGNVVQEFLHTEAVADSLLKVEQAGNLVQVGTMINELILQTKKDIEKSILGDQGSVLESGGTPAESAGFGALIKTNMVSAATASPGVVAGYDQTTGLAADATVASTANRGAFSMSKFNETMAQLATNSSAMEATAFIHPKMAAKIDGTANTNATFNRLDAVKTKGGAELTLTVQVFNTVGGRVELVTTNEATETSIPIINIKEASWAQLRAIKPERLGKRGTSTAFMVSAAGYLKLNGESVHAQLRDLA